MGMKRSFDSACASLGMTMQGGFSLAWWLDCCGKPTNKGKITHRCHPERSVSEAEGSEIYDDIYPAVPPYCTPHTLPSRAYRATVAVLFRAPS